MDRQYLLMGIGVALVLLLGVSFWPGADIEDEEAEAAPAGSLAGGFPTPPMPTGGAVQGAAQPLTFQSPTTTVPAGSEE